MTRRLLIFLLYWIISIFACQITYAQIRVAPTVGYMYNQLNYSKNSCVSNAEVRNSLELGISVARNLFEKAYFSNFLSVFEQSINKIENEHICEFDVEEPNVYYIENVSSLILSAYRNTSILIGLGFRHELKREKNKSSFTRDNIAKKNFWTGNIGIKQDFDSVFVELIYKQVLTKNHSDYFYNSTIDSWILRIGYYFDLKKT